MRAVGCMQWLTILRVRVFIFILFGFVLAGASSRTMNWWIELDQFKQKFCINANSLIDFATAFCTLSRLSPSVSYRAVRFMKRLCRLGVRINYCIWPQPFALHFFFCYPHLVLYPFGLLARGSGAYCPTPTGKLVASVFVALWPFGGARGFVSTQLLLSHCFLPPHLHQSTFVHAWHGLELIIWCSFGL